MRCSDFRRFFYKFIPHKHFFQKDLCVKCGVNILCMESRYSKRLYTKSYYSHLWKDLMNEIMVFFWRLFPHKHRYNRFYECRKCARYKELPPAKFKIGDFVKCKDKYFDIKGKIEEIESAFYSNTYAYYSHWERNNKPFIYRHMWEGDLELLNA